MSSATSDIPEPPEFQEALEASLLLLKSMKQSLRPAPKASSDSLSKLGCYSTRISKSPAISIARSSIKSNGFRDSTPSPIIQPAVLDDGRLDKLALLKTQILACIQCPHLASSRTQVVYGTGNPFAELLFVGEAPGEEEDLRGEPFVGKAGQLLTRIIEAMEYTREEIFIANVLKCRPNMPAGESGNRKPKPAEMATCLPWLSKQIKLIKPRVIVALGLTAIEGLLGEQYTMRDIRGKWLEYRGVPVMPTYHPAYLLRNQTIVEKRKVWEDMLLVLEKIGRPISEQQRGYFLSKKT